MRKTHFKGLHSATELLQRAGLYFLSRPYYQHLALSNQVHLGALMGSHGL